MNRHCLSVCLSMWCAASNHARNVTSKTTSKCPWTSYADEYADFIVCLSMWRMQLQSMRETGLLPQAGSEEERAVLHQRPGDTAGRLAAVDDVLDPKLVSKTKFHCLLKTFKKDGEEQRTRATLPPLQMPRGKAARNSVSEISGSQGMNTTQTGETASTRAVGLVEPGETASVLGSRTGTHGWSDDTGTRKT